MTSVRSATLPVTTLDPSAPAPTAGPAAGAGSSAGAGRVGREVVVFAIIGAASTVLHLGTFAALRHLTPTSPAQAANALALVLATVANTWANRRWTFGVRGREGVVRQQLQGLAILVLTLVTTTGALSLLAATWPTAPTWVETAAVAVATVVSTAVKYAAMRLWMFRPAAR